MGQKSKLQKNSLFGCVPDLLHLAWPVVASQASALTVNMADTFMVGRVGETELAAASFSGNLSIPFMFFGIGMGAAITPIVGKRLGRGDRDGIGRVVAHARRLHWRIVIFQLVALALLTLFMPFMGQPDEVVSIARIYLPIYALSLIGQQMFVCSRTIIEGLQDTASPMIIGLVSNILNIVLNYILIFGLGSFEGFGAYGAAMSTLVARILMWLAMDSVLRAKLQALHVEPSASTGHHGITERLFRVGLPVGLQSVVECVGFAFGGIMMGWISTAAIAAHQVVNLFTSMTFLMATGVGTAVTIKVSVDVGAGNLASARMYAKTGLLIAVSFMTCTAALFATLRGVLPGLIIESPEALAIGAQLMLVGAVFQIFDGLQATAIAALRGFGDFAYPAKVAIIAYAATCIPVGAVLAFGVGLGPTGVWWGFVSGLGLASVLLLVRLFRRYV